MSNYSCITENFLEEFPVEWTFTIVDTSFEKELKSPIFQANSSLIGNIKWRYYIKSTGEGDIMDLDDEYEVATYSIMAVVHRENSNDNLDDKALEYRFYTYEFDGETFVADTPPDWEKAIFYDMGEVSCFRMNDLFSAKRKHPRLCQDENEIREPMRLKFVLKFRGTLPCKEFSKQDDLFSHEESSDDGHRFGNFLIKKTSLALAFFGFMFMTCYFYFG